jgi:hypothetical protein
MPAVQDECAGAGPRTEKMAGEGRPWAHPTLAGNIGPQKPGRFRLNRGLLARIRK